jgi:dTMP kinase
MVRDKDTAHSRRTGEASPMCLALGAARCGGMLITIDGQSGAGKTTTAGLLCERLEERGERVLLTSTPSPSTIGTLARQGTFDFRGRELTLLVAADRFHHERTVIRPALAEGVVVVCDRYVASSFVLDPLDGVERGLVWAIYRDLPAADLSIILRGDPSRCCDRAAARGHYSRFHTSDVDANRRELAAFIDAAAFLREAGYRVVDHDIGAASAEQVTEQLTAAVLNVKEGRQCR